MVASLATTDPSVSAERTRSEEVFDAVRSLAAPASAAVIASHVPHIIRASVDANLSKLKGQGYVVVIDGLKPSHFIDRDRVDQFSEWTPETAAPDEKEPLPAHIMEEPHVRADDTFSDSTVAEHAFKMFDLDAEGIEVEVQVEEGGDAEMAIFTFADAVEALSSGIDTLLKKIRELQLQPPVVQLTVHVDLDESTRNYESIIAQLHTQLEAQEVRLALFERAKNRAQQRLETIRAAAAQEDEG